MTKRNTIAYETDSLLKINRIAIIYSVIVNIIYIIPIIILVLQTGFIWGSIIVLSGFLVGIVNYAITLTLLTHLLNNLRFPSFDSPSPTEGEYDDVVVTRGGNREILRFHKRGGGVTHIENLTK